MPLILTAVLFFHAVSPSGRVRADDSTVPSQIKYDGDGGNSMWVQTWIRFGENPDNPEYNVINPMVFKGQDGQKYNGFCADPYTDLNESAWYNKSDPSVLSDRYPDMDMKSEQILYAMNYLEPNFPSDLISTDRNGGYSNDAMMLSTKQVVVWGILNGGAYANPDPSNLRSQDLVSNYNHVMDLLNDGTLKNLYEQKLNITKAQISVDDTQATTPIQGDNGVTYGTYRLVSDLSIPSNLQFDLTPSTDITGMLFLDTNGNEITNAAIGDQFFVKVPSGTNSLSFQADAFNIPTTVTPHYYYYGEGTQPVVLFQPVILNSNDYTNLHTEYKHQINQPLEITKIVRTVDRYGAGSITGRGDVNHNFSGASNWFLYQSVAKSSVKDGVTYDLVSGRTLSKVGTYTVNLSSDNKTLTFNCELLPGLKKSSDDVLAYVSNTKFTDFNPGTLKKQPGVFGVSSVKKDGSLSIDVSKAKLNDQFYIYIHLGTVGGDVMQQVTPVPDSTPFILHLSPVDGNGGSYDIVLQNGQTKTLSVPPGTYNISGDAKDGYSFLGPTTVTAPGKITVYNDKINFIDNTSDSK